MIQNSKVKSPKYSDLVAFMIFVQNVCISQNGCSPKCPLKDAYYKCKIIARPTWLSNLNSYMYGKVSAAYRLFSRLKDRCMLTHRCKDCRLYDSSNSKDCMYYIYVYKIRSIINDHVTMRNMRY